MEINFLAISIFPDVWDVMSLLNFLAAFFYAWRQKFEDQNGLVRLLLLVAIFCKLWGT